MAYQSGRNLLIAYKEEVAYGVLPGATDASVFRPNSGALNLTKDPINSNENRSDGQTSRGRHGSRSLNGTYAGDLSVGSYDALIEAVMRGTFESELVITEATAGLTSITTTTNTIVAAAGSWITAGLRVGDVIRLTGHATAGNNNRNLRISALTASTITVADLLTLDAVADTAFTITRGKKVIMGTTPRSFTFEENEIDIDASKLSKGIRVSQLALSLQPNGMAVITFTLIGQDQEVETGADAPYFTAPATTVSLGLTAVEAKIRLGTVDVMDVSGVDISINLNAAGFPVVGSVLTPDVFTNLAVVEGSITALKQDVSRLQGFLDETEYSLHLLFEENDATGAPDYCSFFIGNMTLSGATDSDLGADGPRVQTIPLLVGVDSRGGAFDPTMVSFSTSAA